MINEFLKTLGIYIRYKKEYIGNDIYRLYIKKNEMEFLERSLQRLEAIDNAKPSEAMECVDYIENKLGDLRYECKRTNNHRCDDLFIQENTFTTIKQSLLKAQKQEKVLEILKNKKVDIWKFIDNGIFNYSYDDYYFCWNYYSCEKLTQEEFELLKRYLNE